MIRLVNINKTYNKGRNNAFHALKDVSLEIKDGELLAIVGKSGAGKSTLMHILGGIDTYDSGSYLINAGTENEKEVGKLGQGGLSGFRNRHVGIVLQDFGLVEGFSVTENVGIPLHFSKAKRRDYKKKIVEALKSVSIEELAKKPVKKLSGGQKQRTAIARAIVNGPDIILADEPTGALDSETGEQIMELFKKLNKDGKTIVIITHDKEIAAQCDRVVEISDGRVINS